MAAVAVDCIADLRNGDAFARLVAAERGLLDSEFALIVCNVARTPRERHDRAPERPATPIAWGPAPATLPAMRELKARFDPNGTLAPGRYVAGI